MTQSAVTQFSGWPIEAIEYFQGIEVNNTKAFFAENRELYQSAVRGPFDLLNAEVTNDYGPLHIFRPFKDMRFAKGQPPYKTHQGAVTEGESGEMFYLQISASGLLIASGYHFMAKDQLGRFRDAIVDDESGSELEQIVKQLRKASYDISGSALKTAPRGYDKGHPRIELLRHKGITAGRSFAPDSWLSSRRVLGRITKTWDRIGELNAWLGENVGPTTEPPREMR